MANDVESFKMAPGIDEEEIFKSLSHKNRRDIIKLIGNKGELTFTGIKNLFNSIDSPNLSYHLKSLQPLLIQNENKYKLSEIGRAAYDLLQKTDQSYKISKYKKKFTLAYIFTVICWLAAQFVVPLIVYSDQKYFFLIPIVISIVSGVNYAIIAMLRGK